MREVLRSVASEDGDDGEEKKGINTHERSVGAAALQLVKNKLKCFPIKSFALHQITRSYSIYAR